MARSRCTSFRRLSPSSPCVCKFLIAAPANEQAKKKIGEFKKRKGDKRSRLFERPSFLLASIRSHTTRPPPLTFDEGLCDRKVTAARNKGQIEGVVKRSGSLRRQGQETIIWCGEENFVFFFRFYWPLLLLVPRRIRASFDEQVQGKWLCVPRFSKTSISLCSRSDRNYIDRLSKNT